MPRRPAPKRRRERTFDGCTTCRARKIKCDARRPFCTPCEKRGLECSGFEAKIQYVYYDHKTEDFQWGLDHDAKSSSTSRRLLSSECERAAMSKIITSAAQYHEIDDMLEDADEARHDTPEYRPFVVLELESGVQADTSLGLGTLSESDHGQNSLQGHCESRFSYHDSTDDHIIETFEILEQSGSALIRAPTPNLGTVNWSWPADMNEDPILISEDYALLSPVMSWNLTASYDQMIPQQALFLLDHYRQQMVKLFSPKGSQSPPWAILHLPSALSTLSELAVYGNVSSARISLFYSLLAVSAFNLDRINLDVAGVSNFWSKLGDSFRNSAKQEVRNSMIAELSGLRVSKYKDSLMALLSMVTISVVDGRQAEARSFLLDAEHYILTRGIEKPAKSRKVNLLHQIYLFLRITEESTHVYSAPSPASLHNLEACSDSVLRHAMFPSLRTQAALMGKNMDLMTDVLIDRELAGDVSNGGSLFEEIYGIPIQLFSLLSKVTWLANEVRLRDGGFGFDLGLQGNNLTAFARELEDTILAWSLDQSIGEEESEGNSIIMQHLNIAIHNALIIYFYRRIYDINARVLQPYVEKVASHLFAVEQQKLQANLVFNGIAWPGFIAASEAIDPFLRRQLSTWLRNSAQTSGFRNFDIAANVAQQVWRLRDSGHLRASWVDLVERNQLSLVMT